MDAAVIEEAVELDSESSVASDTNDTSQSDTRDDVGAESEAEESVQEQGQESPDGGVGVPPEIPVDLMARAAEMGYTEDEVRELGAPEKVQAELARVDRGITRFLTGAGGTDATSSQVSQRGEGGASQAVGADGRQGGLADQASHGPRFNLELDEEHFDPELVKSIKGMNEFYSGQIKAIQDHFGELVNHLQSAAHDQRVAVFDSQIQALGDDFVDVFGKGASPDLEHTNKAAWEARDKLFRDVDVLRSAYAIKRQRPPADAVLIQRCLHSGFSQKCKEVERAKLEKELASQRRAVIRKPASKSNLGDQSDQQDPVVAEVEEKMRAMGR